MENNVRYYTTSRMLDYFNSHQQSANFIANKFNIVVLPLVWSPGMVINNAIVKTAHSPFCIYTITEYKAIIPGTNPVIHAGFKILNLNKDNPTTLAHHLVDIETAIAICNHHNSIYLLNNIGNYLDNNNMVNTNE